MKLKNWRYLDIFTVFNFQDDRARGRCAMMASAVLSTMVSYLCLSGTLYTAFLTANKFSIVDTGIISFIPPVTASFSIFSPWLLERFKKRKAILIIGRFFYYTINIVGITLLTNFVHDQNAKLIGFGVIVFLSHSFNALTASGYSVWHLNFIPHSIRARYFSYQQIVTSLLSGFVLLGTGLIADAIRGNANEMTILLVLRLVGYALAIGDMVVLALPKEFDYASRGEKIRVSNTFRLPFREKKFMLTMLLMGIWGFGGSLPATWTYYLMNTINIKVTVINVVDFSYAIVLLLLSPFVRKLLSRFSWFNTFAVCAFFTFVLTFTYSFIRTMPNPALFLVIIRLLQHCVGVGLNLSYANFPYINMPRENQTYFISFYTFMANLVAFASQMCGTLIIKLMGDRVVPIFGAVLEAPALLVLVQSLFQLAVAVLIFALRKQLMPNEETA